MSASSHEIEDRARQYANARGLVLEDRLGFGRDGSVFSTPTGTAVKSYGALDGFERQPSCDARSHGFGAGGAEKVAGAQAVLVGNFAGVGVEGAQRAVDARDEDVAGLRIAAEAERGIVDDRSGFGLPFELAGVGVDAEDLALVAERPV